MYLKRCLAQVLVIITFVFVVFSPLNSIKAIAKENSAEGCKCVNEDNRFITGYLDNYGNIRFYTQIGQDRSVTVTIAVFVGKSLAGYLVCTVIDGIVISATGKSGGEWVATAISHVVGKKYTKRVHIPSSGPYTCPGVVIDHSGICN